MDGLREEMEKLKEAYLNEFDRYCKNRMKEEYRRRKFVVCSEKKKLKRVIKRISGAYLKRS